MGNGHGHGGGLPDDEEFTGRDTARLLRLISIGCAVVIVLASAVLWPSRQQTADRSPPT